MDDQMRVVQPLLLGSAKICWRLVHCRQLISGFAQTFVTVRDHRVMQLVNAFAAGFHKQEWKEPVQKAGNAADEHFRAERRSAPQML